MNYNLIIAINSLLLIFAGCSSASYKADHPGASQFSIKTKGAIIEAWEYSGIRAPIILMHGGPGVPEYLSGVARLLNEAGHRVIVYNQRGSGNSRSLDDSYSLEDHVDDLKKVIQYFQIQKVNLFAHSFGGLIASKYLELHPDLLNKLFLSNSSTGSGSDWEEMEKEVMNYNSQKAGFWRFSAMGIWSLFAMLPGSSGDPGARNLMTHVWKNYFDNPKNVGPPSDEWLMGINSTAMRRTRNAVINSPVIQTNAKHDKKILILYGDKDIYGKTTNVLSKKYKGAKFIILKNSGHVPWIDSPKEFSSILLSFFKTRT